MERANLSDRAKALYFDLIFPPIYDSDLTDKQIEKRQRKHAINWLKRFDDLFQVEQNSHDKPLTYLQKFAKENNGEGANIASRLHGWENYQNFSEIAREIKEKWEIEESEYRDSDPITADIEQPLNRN